jgi:hypothetical protein
VGDGLAVGVRLIVGEAVEVAVGVIIGVGDLGGETNMLSENSEVLPSASVAVEVKYCPGWAPITIAVNAPSPPAVAEPT